MVADNPPSQFQPKGRSPQMAETCPYCHGTSTATYMHYGPNSEKLRASSTVALAGAEWIKQREGSRTCALASAGSAETVRT